MVQSSIEEAASNVALHTTIRHSGVTENVPIQPVNDAIRANMSPVFGRKIISDQGTQYRRSPS